jgi:hypothetical protein
MKRNIFITIDNSNNNPEYIHITKIESIINHSCDSIIINCLEYIDNTDHAIVLTNLLNKIRLNGRLIIKTNNATNIATRFLEKTISEQDFLKFFTNKRSLVSVESIYTIVDFKVFDMIDLDITDDIIKIVLERKSL